MAQGVAERKGAATISGGCALWVWFAFAGQFVQGIGISTTSPPLRLRMVQTFSAST
jgi:hypothetical protein